MTTKDTFAFDKGGNLVCNGTPSKDCKMYTDFCGNRAVDELIYQSNMSIESCFDPHGNQLKTGAFALSNEWNFLNQLQTTTQPLENGNTLTENNLFGVPGQRTRKVSEINDPSGKVVEITEVLFNKKLEFYTLWKGSNLEFDGETVLENGQKIAPWKSYQARKIKQNHRQLAQEVIQETQDKPSSKAKAYYLDNHLDSCELLINEDCELQSYQTFDPFGNTEETFGDIEYKTVKYSGETKDQSGLYNYGFRSYLPKNFRWISPDPTGQAGSGLNRYAMAGNNPTTERDKKGLMVPGLLHPYISYYYAAILHDLTLKYYNIDAGSDHEPGQPNGQGGKKYPWFKRHFNRFPFLGFVENKNIWTSTMSNWLGGPFYETKNKTYEQNLFHPLSIHNKLKIDHLLSKDVLLTKGGQFQKLLQPVPKILWRRDQRPMEDIVKAGGFLGSTKNNNLVSTSSTVKNAKVFGNSDSGYLYQLESNSFFFFHNEVETEYRSPFVPLHQIISLQDTSGAVHKNPEYYNKDYLNEKDRLANIYDFYYRIKQNKKWSGHEKEKIKTA